MKIKDVLAKFKGMKSMVMMVAIVLVVSAFAASNGILPFMGSKSQAVEVEAPHKITVNTTVAKSVEKSANLKIKATLEPVEEGVVTSSLSGKAVKVLFKEGDAVQVGTPLVLIDDRDYKIQLKAAEISLKKLEVAKEAALKEVVRMKELVQSGSATPIDLETAERAVTLNDLEMDTVKTTIENVQNTLSNTVISAPIAGVIDNKEVKIGQFVGAGTVVTKVKKVSMLNAIVRIDQATARGIKMGQMAEVTLEGIKDPLKGTITYMDVAADPDTRTFKCKVEVDNHKGLLKPGTYAQVKIKGTGAHRVVEVPIKAVMGNEDQYSVYVNHDGRAKRVAVVLGEIGSDSADVVSGLREGDAIVVSNLTDLQEGDAIVVSNKKVGVN